MAGLCPSAPGCEEVHTIENVIPVLSFDVSCSTICTTSKRKTDAARKSVCEISEAGPPCEDVITQTRDVTTPVCHHVRHHVIRRIAVGIYRYDLYRNRLDGLFS